MRTHSPSPPPLDADAPLRVALNNYASCVASVTLVTFFVGVSAALLFGVVAGVSGTTVFDLPLQVAGGLFCFSLPILVVAAVVVQFTAPRRFRYANRRLAATIAAVRAGDPRAREQLLDWAADHALLVRDALRTHYHPDLLPSLLPLVQDASPARQQLALVLLDLKQPAVLPALLPLLEGRRHARYLKQRMRMQRDEDAAFIAGYVLEPLRRWNGPPHPPPNANLLRALLIDWPTLATDDDIAQAQALPDFRCTVVWLNGLGDVEQRHKPRAFVAVREAAAQVARKRGL